MFVFPFSLTASKGAVKLAKYFEWKRKPHWMNISIVDLHIVKYKCQKIFETSRYLHILRRSVICCSAKKRPNTGTGVDNQSINRTTTLQIKSNRWASINLYQFVSHRPFCWNWNLMKIYSFKKPVHEINGFPLPTDIWLVCRSM